jgi:homoaconitase/3-isopropylmalate dehydratase large subunit
VHLNNWKKLFSIDNAVFNEEINIDAADITPHDNWH